MSTDGSNTTSSQKDEIPRPKKARSKAFTGLGHKLGLKTLPPYSGPYSVGYMDIEIPVREPRSFSHIRRDHKQLLNLETVLFSLYYPCNSVSKKGHFSSSHGKSSKPTWLPHPRVEMGKGYARFSGLRNWPTLAMVAGTTMSTKLPATRNAPLADYWPPDQKPESFTEGTEKPIFPLLIFSHGLGGTKTTYSSLCGNFASHGFVVCALEHRDGSGPRTFVNESNEETQTPSKKSQGKKARLENNTKIDYVFPQGNEYDTRPSNERGIDAELRTAQIQLRLAEIEEAFHVLRMIRNGEGETTADSNLRRPGNIGSSSSGLDGVDWQSWVGKFLLEQVTVAGHSFGGATAVEVLRHTDRFQFVGQGIIYDIWGAAIQPPEDENENRIRRPLLCINSEAFMYWPTNFEAVLTLCKEASANGVLSWLMTVRGTVHLSLSDFSVLYPRLFSLFCKATANPRRAILLHINASLEFLNLVMPKNMSRMLPETNDLLGIAPLEELPDERKPADEKWIAMRLRIPHEMTLRLKPRIVRRHVQHKRAKQAGIALPVDPSGKALDALHNLGIGEEVWMHFAPLEDELAYLGLEPGKGQETSHCRIEPKDGVSPAKG